MTISVRTQKTWNNPLEQSQKERQDRNLCKTYGLQTLVEDYLLKALDIHDSQGCNANDACYVPELDSDNREPLL